MIIIMLMMMMMMMIIIMGSIKHLDARYLRFTKLGVKKWLAECQIYK